MKNISGYLIATIRDYFYKRTIVDAGTSYTLTTGIPQGSVMGPLLWNIMYDPIFEIKYPDGVEAIGFADDLAATIVARTRDELRDRVNETMNSIHRWMEQNKLSIVPEKTGLVILYGPRARRQFKFKLNGTIIAPTKHLKYIGVTISENFYLAQHVKDVVEKAGKRLQSLRAIMPNMKGPSYQKRRLLYGVLQSSLMYAAQIWGGMLALKKYRKMAECVQRKALIRIISAYRTISTGASQVIAGIAPIDLEITSKLVPRVQEQRKQWIEEKWQERWDKEEETAQWTKRLIPNIKTWTECKHKCTDYYLTQALSGHGCFKAYTQKIGKTDENCLYCGKLDTAEHTLFECERWFEYRRQAETKLNGQITPETMINLMITNKETWKHIWNMITEILTKKEAEERKSQKSWSHPRPT